MTRRIIIVAAILLAGCSRPAQHEKTTTRPANQSPGATTVANPDHGKQLIEQNGCTSCHVIPGLKGPKGKIGPSLEHVATRPIIASRLQNTPETMTRYLLNPQAANPDNAMPNMDLTSSDARDITTYLYTLK